MRTSFPLFYSHLDLAHHYWSQLLQPGDAVVDATCGNGHDTLKLSRLTLSNDQGKVYAFDRQREAIESTRHYLEQHLTPEILARVEFHQRCHSTFSQWIPPESIKLAVYNLGYLPGGDKTLTTCTDTTLESLRQAQKLLLEGGVLSITCYPGHEEGAKEQESLLDYISTLSPKEWNCCHHEWINRERSPSLLLIQRKNEKT